MNYHIPNITPKRTVRTVSGSPRHVTKTHGTHNGRTGSWPHVSDAIERPSRLPDLAGVQRADRKRGRRHKRVRQPRITISKHMYQDPAKDITPLPVWVVEGQRLYDDAPVHVRLCAQSEPEAIDIGEECLRRSEGCMIINLSAERRQRG